MIFMAPTVESGTPAQERPSKRLRSYLWVGILVLLCFAGVLALGYLGWEGPVVFQRDTSWLVGLSLAILALGLLYVLFTFRGAMRFVREESVAIARPEPPFIEREPAIVAAAPAPPPAPVPERPSRPVSLIEGIGPTYGSRLKGIGVETLRDLRNSDERRIQEATGANLPTVHQWRIMAHLMALDGVDAQAAELLVRSGYETLDSISRAEPDALHRDLRRVNEAREVRIYPGPLHSEEVSKWVHSARNARASGFPARIAGSGRALNP